jgi:hypothetical protein
LACGNSDGSANMNSAMARAPRGKLFDG